MMGNMQQIIVYRNPLEAAMWNSLFNAEFHNTFPLMVAAVCFIICMCAFNNRVEKFLRKHKYNHYTTHVTGFISLAVAACVAWGMWI